MNAQFSLHPLQLSDPAHQAALVDLWNATIPTELPISTNLLTYNIGAVQGEADSNAPSNVDLQYEGQWVLQGAERVGIVLVSRWQGAATVAAPTTGWIELLAVHPQVQRQGIGKRLMQWAEQWLLEQGCQTIHVGGSPRPFTPGVPTALDTTTFFTQIGYGAPRSVWDLAANLATYVPPSTVQEVAGLVRPAQPADREPLTAFLQREFPGRWLWHWQQSLAAGAGRLTDYMVLWTEHGIDGFCCLTFEDSVRPIERYYPYQLPRPWGQLGPIGISKGQRGQGFGAALLDGALRRLHNNGINGCIIDWTTLLDFYAPFGFTPHREYHQLTKQLSG